MRRSKYQGKFKLNQQFGWWVVMNPDVKMDTKGRARVMCTCTCGLSYLVSCHHLLKNRSTRCAKCNLSNRGRGYRKNPNWRGDDLVPKTFITKLSSSAASSNVPFTLTTSYVNDLYNSSGGSCSFTGKPINFETNTVTAIMLNNSEGYVEGNVTLTSPEVAASIKKSSPNEFIQMCLEVAKKYK